MTSSFRSARKGIAAIVVAFAAPAAIALTFTVTRLDDAGPGSLRDAVAQANQSPGADTIDVAVTGTIALTGGALRISDALAITGPASGELIVRVAGTGPVFTTLPAVPPACPATTGASDFVVALSRLTLEGGSWIPEASVGGVIRAAHSLVLDAVVVRGGTAENGGGIGFLVQFPGQSLTVRDSLVTGNTATQLRVYESDAFGGGVYAADRCEGQLVPAQATLERAVVQGNVLQAGLDIFSPAWAAGGGLALLGNIALLVQDSRIAGNDSPGSAGGIYTRSPAPLRIERSEIAGNVGGGIATWDSLVVAIDHSTFSENDLRLSGTVRIRNATIDSTVFAPFAAVEIESSILNALAATTASVRNSIVIDPRDTAIQGTGNLLRVDALLDPLADNGGRTRTRAVRYGSPAIDAGSNPAGLATDQRGAGFSRVLGAGPDIGAYESRFEPAAGGCAGFADVPASDDFCGHVTWLRNRAITHGCSAGAYCPRDAVSRAAMAMLQHRFGSVDRVAPLVVRGAWWSNSGDLRSELAFCPLSLPSNGGRALRVRLDGFVAGHAGTGATNSEVTLVASIDGGATWGAVTSVPASFSTDLWRRQRLVGHFDTEAGQLPRFAIHIAPLPPAQGTEDDTWSQLRCQLWARLDEDR